MSVEANQSRIPNFLHKVESVSDVYKAPRLSPELYPGDRPETPVALLDGDNLYGLRWNADSKIYIPQGELDPVLDTELGPYPLDDYLRSRGLPVLAERYPLTAFGSNRCPGQLLDKFRKATTQTDGGHADTDNPAGTEVVPMFMGTLKGYDAVYNSKAGNMGFFFADLYQGPETQETEIEVTVLFLTKEQLQILHETEKEYDFKLLGTTKVGTVPNFNDGGTAIFEIPAFAHVGKVTAYAAPNEDGQASPVALSEINSLSRGIKSLDQVSFQELVFSRDPEGNKQKAFASITGDQGIEASSSNFMDNMKMERAGGKRKLAERKEFQRLLNLAITDDERIVIDPDAFQAQTVDVENEPIPNLGVASVLNFIEIQGRKQ